MYMAGIKVVPLAFHIRRQNFTKKKYIYLDKNAIIVIEQPKVEKKEEKKRKKIRSDKSKTLSVSSCEKYEDFACLLARFTRVSHFL